MLTAQELQGVEATLIGTFWGDDASLTDERRPSPIWTALPSGKWERYATWLAGVDTATRRRHHEAWLAVVAETRRLGELPVMGRAPDTPLDENVRQIVEMLLHRIASMVTESEQPMAARGGAIVH